MTRDLCPPCAEATRIPRSRFRGIGLDTRQARRARRRAGRHRAHHCGRLIEGETSVAVCDCPCNTPTPEGDTP